MLLLAWLLSLLCAVGCYQDRTKYYGSTFKMRLNVGTKVIDFIPSYETRPQVLWRDDGNFQADSRRKVVGNYFTIYNVTQLDNGDYTMKDRNRLTLSRSKLEVEENTQSHQRKSGESFHISFELPRDSCNIYFRSWNDDDDAGHKIVTRGSLDSYRFPEECNSFELLPPCNLEVEYLQASCSGSFIFRDRDGNTALVADLDVEGSAATVDLWKIGVSSAVASLLLGCCCCLKRCCCGKKSKKAEAETPDGEAGLNLQQYQQEPVALRTYQHNPVTLYPALPPEVPTDPSVPLVHSTPPAMPPAYSEASVPAATSDAPTGPFPLDSGPEPRFQLTFDSPLDQNSSQSDVYTSDKLNFL